MEKPELDKLLARLGLVNEKDKPLDTLIRVPDVETLLRLAEESGADRGAPEVGNFFGGLDWQTMAVNARRGDPEIAAKAEALLDQVDRFTAETEGRQWTAMPAGAYPIVPEALAGSPTPMRGYQSVASEHMPLSIYVATTSSARYGLETLLARGVAILALVSKLQAIRPVDLHIMSLTPNTSSWTGDGNMIVVTRLETRPLDLSVAGFVLAHCAFDRRVHLGLCVKLGKDARWAHIAWSEIFRNGPAAIRAYVGMGPDDLYIAPAHLDDSMIKEPVKWVNEQVRKALHRSGDA